MSIIGPVIQIIAAIVLVLLLFAIGFLIFNMEMIRSKTDAGKLKRVVPIFTGMCDISASGTATTAIYNTMNPKDPMYKAIVPSVNQMSGAEFTYNFWLFKDNSAFVPASTSGDRMTTDKGLRPDDFILFVHGEQTASQYNNVCGVAKTDVRVKCPLVKLERGGTVLTVELNTMASSDAVHENSRNTCNDDSRDWYVMNAHKIAIYTDQLSNAANYDKKWFMVSIVITETSPEDPFPLRNKTRCRIYVNGNMELDRYLDDSLGVAMSQSLLRRNTGSFIVAPSVALPGSKRSQTLNGSVSTPPSNKVLLADLTYFNYALTEDEVKSMVEQGFTKDWAIIGRSRDNQLTDITSTDNMSLPSNSRQFNAF